VKLVETSRASAMASNQKSRAPHDIPVTTAMARIGDMDQYLVGLGNVTPISTVTVKSRVDGAIDKIAFTEGQIVKTGDLLFEIDPRPYEAALKQAQGQLAKDKATKVSADWNVAQDQQALPGGGIAKQQLVTDTATRDNAVGAIEVDEAAIDTAKLNITYAHITSPITGRIGLRLVDLGNIVHAADTTGMVVITQMQPITVVFSLPEDDLPQIQKRLAGGQPLVVDAYDRDLTVKLATGKLLALDSAIDPTSGNIKIKAIFDNQNNELFPSQFVNARMLINTVHDAVLVPSAAIQHTPTSTFVYVFQRDPAPATVPALAAPASTDSPQPTKRPDRGPTGKVTMRQVTVGPSQEGIGPDEEDTTVVLDGIAAGDVVVTDGVDKLQEGTRVISHMAASVSGGHRGATTQPGGSTTRPAGSMSHRKRKPAAQSD
jgi:multidrug efflux system membrane fusion protein